MSTKRFLQIGGAGCVVVIVAVIVVLSAMAFLPAGFSRLTSALEEPINRSLVVPRREPLPTSTPPPQSVEADRAPSIDQGLLADLYRQLNPGVVSIQVMRGTGGSVGGGAGSGFILDGSGRIVTNNHVVAGAQRVTVIFFNGIEVEAEILGTDDDSDLAVIQVDGLPEGTHALPLGDSDASKVGDWVVAIGNPFGLSGSMTLGIVSAVGRTIPSGATTFSIPEAIQTDAAINPGNSGGPLLNLEGEVIGVNAQIASGGGRANAGVGFAIPSKIVRLVAPILIRRQPYQWPWVGVTGGDVGLLLKEANDLDTQRGAYIDKVVADSPAAQAGLQGTSDTKSVDGIPMLVGGDVVVEVDGRPVMDFADLLVQVAFRQPGDTLELTILRDGQRRQVTVTLASRPESDGP